MVAKVENGQLTLKPVTLGRDFGKEIAILSGVAVGDDLVINAPDALGTH